MGLVGALTILGVALWVRRSSLHCRNEGAPTLILIGAAATAYLTSPHASALVGPVLHRLTGSWNYEDFLGHMVVIGVAAAAVYMCLIRLGDPESDQAYFEAWISWPLTIIIPLLHATWIMSDVADQRIDLFIGARPDSWLAAYWTLLCGTVVYLLWHATRIARVLRDDEQKRGRRVCTYVLNLWIATFGATIIYAIVLHLYLHLYVTSPLNPSVVAVGSYATLAMWAVAPAYSWAYRSRALAVPDGLPLPSEDQPIRPGDVPDQGDTSR